MTSNIFSTAPQSIIVAETSSFLLKKYNMLIVVLMNYSSFLELNTFLTIFKKRFLLTNFSEYFYFDMASKFLRAGRAT